MIAYNHYIKFIPELKNDQKIENAYEDELTVQKDTFLELDEKLLYELNFFNNQGRDISLYTDREFTRTEKEQLWAFEIKGVFMFYWYSGTKSLHYIPQENFTEALLEYWSLHIVIPMFFTIEETYDFLHAGAVEVGGKPVLFVADSFGGKSTMTDFFKKQGHTMISDDKVASVEKDGAFFAIPSHSHHRPYREMEDLGFFVENFATKPKPIHVIYELEKSDTDVKIEIIQINGVEKFKSLYYASEMNNFFQKARHFEFLMKMAKVVPVYKVTVPWDIGRLGEVHNTICNHSKDIK